MVLEKQATSSTINISLDIIEIILLLQPSESLLRFKSVCKSWNNIISDYEFAKNHLQQSKINSRKQNFILWEPSKHDDDQWYRLVKFENGKFQKIHENPHPREDLLCYADGLALLSTSCGTSYQLWNPCTNQKTVISCPLEKFYNYWTGQYGFCRGPTLDDYKIVVASRRLGYYAVYSCKNKAWTKKKESPYNVSIDWRMGGLFVDTFSFWLTIKETIDDHTKWEIIYFDPRDETFKKLKKSEKIKMEVIKGFSITSLNGCLCLYEDILCFQEEQLRIWILRDNNVDDSSNSWSELMIINNNGVRGLRCWIFTPLFFTERNELLIRFRFGEDKLGIYKSMEKKFEMFDAPQTKIFTKTFNYRSMCGYIVFSLLSIERKNMTYGIDYDQFKVFNFIIQMLDE